MEIAVIALSAALAVVIAALIFTLRRVTLLKKTASVENDRDKMTGLINRDEMVIFVNYLHDTIRYKFWILRALCLHKIQNSKLP